MIERDSVGVKENEDQSIHFSAEKPVAPEAACYPENKFWIPEYGNVLIMIGRHGQSDTYHLSDAGLSGAGKQEAAQMGDEILQEIRTLPLPRSHYYVYTDRRRAEETEEIIYHSIELAEDVPHTIASVSMREPRLSTANHINEVVKDLKHTPGLVIPTWLQLSPEEAEEKGAIHKSQTLNGVMEYLNEANQIALDDIDEKRMHIHIITSHEPTHGAVADAFFPDEDPQAKNGEIISFTTGNAEGLVGVVFRNSRRVVRIGDYL